MAGLLPAPVSRRFTSQNTQIHYLDWGNEGAPTLLMLHGGRDHAHSWDHLAAAMRDQWRIVAPDLRGHGDSDWSPEGNYSGLGLLTDLVGLVRHLDCGPVSILAHSLGGRTALRYASLWPGMVRRMVSIEGTGLINWPRKPPVERWPQYIEFKRTLADHPPRRFASIDEAYERLHKTYPQLSAARARYLATHGVRANGDGTWSWKYDPAARNFMPIDLKQDEEEGMWAAISCPLLLIWGTNSFALDPLQDGAAALFRDVEVIHVEGAGHWPQHDDEPLVLREASRFLEKGLSE